ncbi:MAG: bifunctional phosphoribosylaminoimidazolecarboxamide formyltransferase/IMP cyclohydrolase [Chitinophagaceae bacterium]|nr:bifunctional phosphoribosylaminoimidazolecarboxamide formyltransferase/IMP cyclohydrolase [Chitinophagaceae bacterium]
MKKNKAILSVYDKSNLETIALALIQNNIELLATGGTLKFLQEKNIEVTDVTSVTNFPEMLDGRVKTLDPKLFAGILYKRNNEQHQTTIENHQLVTIDYVIVNLYPFFEKQKENLSHEALIEFIDIGGPSLLRAAAKNYFDVTVLTDVDDYKIVVEEIAEHKSTLISTRKRLAAKVFNLTSAYDASIANYLNEEPFPKYFNASFERKEILRYGENPHQQAAVYTNLSEKENINAWQQIQGKELSYNNYRDIQAAISVVNEFHQPTCCAVKHNTPCGVAQASNDLEAYSKAYNADPVSIFGGIVAFNTTVTKATAEKLNEIFLEVIIAPQFEAEALEIFAKKKNLRVLQIPKQQITHPNIISIDGGLLVQTKDNINSYELNCVTQQQPSQEQIEQLVFAQNIVKHCSSNAIVLVNEWATVGIGSGQTSRIDALKQAIQQAQENKTNLAECVLASDAFFPFDDIVNICASHSIKAIIQPGGSIKDKDSIEACNKHNIAMLFTGIRHFKH